MAYTPKDLTECFQLLQIILPRETVTELKFTDEEDLYRYHLGLGMGLRNNWGLWRNSRLRQYFNKMGIHHPDDMSGIIIKSFWRYLSYQPIRLEEQIEYYQRYWEEKCVKSDKRKGLNELEKQ